MNAYYLEAWRSYDCPADMVCDAAAACCVVRPGCALGGETCGRSEDCCNSQCVDGVCSAQQPSGFSCTSDADCFSGHCSALGVCQINGQICYPTNPGDPGPNCEELGCTADGEKGSAGADCCSGLLNADGYCATLGSRAPGLPCATDLECGSLRCGPDCTCLRQEGLRLDWPDGMECNSGEQCAGGLCDLTARCRSTCAAAGEACDGDADCCGGMCGSAGICVSLACSVGGAPCDVDTDCCSGECVGGSCPGPGCRDTGRTCTRDEQCCGSRCLRAPEVGQCG
jgi:hypothetical protein